MQSRDAAHLYRMRQAINKIERQMDGVDFERFLTDIYVADAVAMQLIVLGEAANKLSEASKAEFTEIAWRRIISLRNLIAHEYDRLEPARLWDIVTGHVVRLSADLPDASPSEADD